MVHPSKSGGSLLNCCCSCDEKDEDAKRRCRCPQRGRVEALVLARVLFTALIVVGLIAAVVYFKQIKSHANASLRFIRSLGVIKGSLVLCAANIIGAILFLPCLPFTMAAGFLYGLPVGTLVVSIASNIAAVVAFLTARHLARSWVEKKLLAKHARFRVLDNAMKKDAFRIVFLVRCSPLHPYGVFNYLFGVTSVTLYDYAIAGFLAMMPTTVMEVYLGTAVKSVGELVTGRLHDSLLSKIFFYVGLISTIAVTLSVSYWVKRKLDMELDGYQPVDTVDRDAHRDPPRSHVHTMAVQAARSHPHQEREMSVIETPSSISSSSVATIGVPSVTPTVRKSSGGSPATAAPHHSHSHSHGHIGSSTPFDYERQPSPPPASSSSISPQASSATTGAMHHALGAAATTAFVSLSGTVPATLSLPSLSSAGSASSRVGKAR